MARTGTDSEILKSLPAHTDGELFKISVRFDPVLVGRALVARYVPDMSLSAVEDHFPHTQAVDEVVDELRIGRPCLGLTGGQLGRLRSHPRPCAQPAVALRKLCPRRLCTIKRS